MSLLADALWSDLKLGVLARSRAAHDECAALHAAGKVDALVARAADAFAGREENFHDAAQAAIAQANRRDLAREYEKRATGRHADLVLWLYDAIGAPSRELSNSRLFLDPPHADRVWIQRQTSWDLAWRHAGEWKLKNLKAVRESNAAALETLLRVRVAGVERPNPRLPS